METKHIAIAVAMIVMIAGVATVVILIDEDHSEEKIVYYTTMAPNLMDAWLAENQTSAYIAWEPYASSAVVAGTGRVLMYSSEIMPHHPCCVVLAYNPFIEGDLGGGVTGEVLTLRFLKAHIDATEWVVDALADKDGANYTMLVDMAVGFTQRSSAVVEEAFEHVVYGYEMDEAFNDALKQFTQMYIDSALVTNESLSNLGYSSASAFIDDYVNESYLDASLSVTPNSTILNPSNPIRLGYLSGDLHQIAQVVALNKSAFGGTSMFEKYGLNVDPLDPFLNGNAEMLGFKMGQVDIGYLGAPPAINKRVNDLTDTVIVAQANSEGTSLIVSANSDVNDLEDLVGKTVSTPGELSIQHLLLKIALNREGIAFVKG